MKKESETHHSKNVNLASCLVGSGRYSLPTIVKNANDRSGNKLKLFAIFAISSLIVAGTGLNVHALSNNIESNSAPTIKYHVKVGDQKYFIKINVCSEKTIEKPNIIVKTDREIKTIPYKKIIFAGTCKSVETVVNAKYPSNTTVELAGNSLA